MDRDAVRTFVAAAKAGQFQESELATLVGERSRYLWPDSYDLRCMPVRDPTPVCPMSLVWHGNSDTTGAFLGVETIITGLRRKPEQPARPGNGAEGRVDATVRVASSHAVSPT